MNNDRIAALYAGHMGVCVVLVNVLIDKGIITEDELRYHFAQAQRAASQCSDGPAVAQVFADMLQYLEPAVHSES